MSKENFPIGEITLVGEDNKLIGLWILGQKYYGGKMQLDYPINKNYPVFVKVREWLKDYFSGKNPKIDFELNPQGTEFQTMIWKMLIEIPYGKTITYGDLAFKYAKMKNITKMSARGIGSAIGKNPISIIIPCHRVIGANGKLTGYAGGLDKKEYLLNLENVIL